MTCNELDLLLSLRAAGALEPAEAATVDAHLAGCARCRAEADALARVLDLARLPPPSEAERRAAADLPARTVAALRRDRGRQVDLRRSRWFQVTAAVAVAAAVLLAFLAPALLGRSPSLPPGDAGAGVPVAAQSWEAPDLDTLWEETEVLDLDGAAFGAWTTTADLGDAALAAADF